jgi:hypothetical protein
LFETYWKPKSQRQDVDFQKADEKIKLGEEQSDAMGQNGRKSVAYGVWFSHFPHEE